MFSRGIERDQLHKMEQQPFQIKLLSRTFFSVCVSFIGLTQYVIEY